MKNFLLLVICLFTFIGCNAEQDSYKIDPQATMKAPWKTGDIVAKIATSLSDDPKYGELSYIYRKFLGITINGDYLVQEFYEIGGKNALTHI